MRNKKAELGVGFSLAIGLAIGCLVVLLVITTLNIDRHEKCDSLCEKYLPVGQKLIRTDLTDTSLDSGYCECMYSKSVRNFKLK